MSGLVSDTTLIKDSYLLTIFTVSNHKLYVNIFKLFIIVNLIIYIMNIYLSHLFFNIFRILFMISFRITGGLQNTHFFIIFPLIINFINFCLFIIIIFLFFAIFININCIWYLLGTIIA